MSEINIFFEEDDNIWNPIVCPVYIMDEYWGWELEPHYQASKLWLWNAVHKGFLLSDVSLYKLAEVSKPISLRVQNLLTPFGPKWRYGYQIPTEMETLLREEFVVPISVSEMWFSKAILEEIEGTTFATAKVYRFTSKKEPWIHIFWKIQTFWWQKPDKSKSIDYNVWVLQPIYV